MLILSILIISLAFFAESIFGFGGGLISIPLLSILLGVKTSVTLVLVFQLLMGLLIFKSHKHINWKIALPMTIGLVIGTLLGTYSLSIASDVFLRKFLALSVLVFLVKMLFFQGFTFGTHKNKLWGFLAGLVGGWLQGIIGTGGPIFTMYLTVALPEKLAFRATLIYLFFATSVIRAIASIPTGLITPQLITIFLPIIPFFLVAIFVGQHLHHKISEKQYRLAINLILFFSSISLLLK